MLERKIETYSLNSEKEFGALTVEIDNNVADSAGLKHEGIENFLDFVSFGCLHVKKA